MLDAWTDRRIEASQDWHDEIRKAMDETCLAVLLVSQTFLNSEYIKDYELPALVQAREQEQIGLVPIFLRPSHVPDSLTKYQGLNRPNHPISELEGHDREQEWVRITGRLRDLARRFCSIRKRKPPEDYELTVSLQPRDRKLIRTYSLPDWPRFLQEDLDSTAAREDLAYWRECGAPQDQAAELGGCLFELLLGPAEGDLSRRVLRTAFDYREPQDPQPLRYPLRVRIRTADPDLVGLPWSLTSWGEESLWESAGWTFELAPEPSTGPDPWEERDVQLRTPCAVLAIAPEPPGGSLRSEPHCRGLEHLVQVAWPDHHASLLQAATRREIENAIREHRPQVVYYFGRVPDGEQALPLRGAGGKTESLPLAELAALWTDQPPKVVLLNLVGEAGGIAAAVGPTLLPAVPFAAVRTTHDPANTFEARSTAMRWLEALLKGADPVWAAHEYGLSGATVWAAYRRWSVRTAVHAPAEALVELLLDRHVQRGLITSAVNELVQDSDRRVQAVLAYGAKNNRVAYFSTQLKAHLKVNVKEAARINQVSLQLPSATTAAGRKAVERELRKSLGLGPRDGLLDGLRPFAPQKIGRAFPVLLLDWKLCQDSDVTSLARRIDAWLAFCCEDLTRACPPDLRLLCYLAAELPEDDHPALRKALDAILRHERFQDFAFTFEPLPPLGHVTVRDLAHYMRDRRNCNAPDGIRHKLPELIYRDTGGEFDATVKRLQQGARTHWQDLCDELERK